MSGTTSITQIQLRRGPQSDLPGEPVSGNPSAPTTGLNPGEPAFASDTGRVFIGSDPSQQGPTTSRAAFPYTNIEILTENSTDALQAVFDRQFRDTATSYYNGQLEVCSVSDTDDWRNVTTTVNGATPSFVVTNMPNIGSAQIFYFLFDSNLVPIRTGRLSVFSTGSTMTPALTDEGTTLPRTDVGVVGSTSTSLLYGSTQFRAMLQSSSTGPQVVLQYRNIGPTTQTMQFRIERALP